MDSSTYRRLIEGVCNAAGIPEHTDDVVARGHIEVEGVVVGLMHDEQDIHSSRLSVFAEIDGPGPSLASHELFQRLMEANVAPHGVQQGYFGLHPDTGGVTYCLKVESCEQMDGDALIDLIVQQLHESKRVLELARH